MRVPTSYVDRIVEWAREGIDRHECIERLKQDGFSRDYARIITREAAIAHNLGWHVNTSRNSAERAATAAARLKELHAAGKSREETIAIVMAEVSLSRTAVTNICAAHNIRWTVTRPAPSAKPVTVTPAPTVPLAAQRLVQRVLDDLASELDPIATPCEYPAEEGQGEDWGVAACYGDPVRVILAHDYDDWRRQYHGETTERKAHVSRATGPALRIA